MRKIPRSSRFVLSCFLTVGIFCGVSTPSAVAAGNPAAGAPPTGPAIPDQTYEAVDAFLREQIDAMGLPGAAVVIVKDGVQVHSAAFGHADDTGRPMSAQTPVLLASTTKPLTAMAVMQQVEAGRLRLDEPVQTYLPWFTLRDSRSAAITVRHLLHQTSGMASKDTAFEASDAQGPEAIEEGVRALSGSPLAGAPGDAFRYASANFNILGLLVQTVSGQPFADYMEQHVFEPLGMVTQPPDAGRSPRRQCRCRLFTVVWLVLAADRRARPHHRNAVFHDVLLGRGHRPRTDRPAGRGTVPRPPLPPAGKRGYPAQATRAD